MKIQKVRYLKDSLQNMSEEQKTKINRLSRELKVVLKQLERKTAGD